MDNETIISWLLDGDVSIQFQVYRDLIHVRRLDLQERITKEGWGARLITERKKDGHWGQGYYQPKWISSHYTLLDLKNLNCHHYNHDIRESINMVLDTQKALDGGICLGPSTKEFSDICVNAMLLNFAAYFRISEDKLESIVDSILDEIMEDGGFNCRTTRTGAKHSSLHTTISVLEGFLEFKRAGYDYRLDEIELAETTAREFILKHKLFLSDHTGEIIHKDFLKMPYPWRWKYNITRAMDYFRASDTEWDERMRPAMEEILKRRKSSGLWTCNAAHPGKIHFIMESAGKPSRWNTLICLRVLDKYRNNLGST